MELYFGWLYDVPVVQEVSYECYTWCTAPCRAYIGGHAQHMPDSPRQETCHLKVMQYVGRTMAKDLLRWSSETRGMPKLKKQVG